MNKVYTIFSEILKLCPRYQFDSAVQRHQGDRYVKTFTTWQQFMTILYSQITQKDSLRDIVTGLSAHAARWYHLGLTGIHKSTLSDANAKRDYRIFEGLFYHLLARCKNLTPKHKFRFKNPLYTIDASTTHLCLSVFPWAKFRTTKGAIKMHCLYDHSGALPSFLTVTDGKKHDVCVVKETSFPLSPDSIVSVDKAYIDYKWLNSLDEKGVWFVTRAKKNIDYAVVGQHPVTGKGVLSDERISLQGPRTKTNYPKDLRLIMYHDEERKKTLTFLTNNFKLAAQTIAQIYKSRWQIELFFKWIKQNLKIKSFLGTSKNAVLTQIWVAMCYYLLLTYIKYQTKYGYSLLQLSRVIKEMLFQRKSLIDVLTLGPERLRLVQSEALQGALF
ncbi:MAG TPA: IS4 family transposase [Candidatus Brocadiales bacterium]|nr:IS4 family transposase [Candidatus Brocadiales bacterium]